MKAKKNSIRTISMILVFAVICFICLLMVARRASGNYDVVNLIVANQELPLNTEITEENVNKYFSEVTVNAELSSKDSIKDMKILVGKFTSEPIYKKELVHTASFSSKKEILEEYDDPYEGSIKVEEFSDAVSGTIRAGDYVNIYVIDELSNESKKVNKENAIYISNVFDSNGARIEPGDEESVAVSFNFYIEKSESQEFYENVTNKKIILTKVK
ncbi:hypothetical protein [uncultured Clostridium sp.]|uniref:hypothetical protein n=1 Tax=uncultured Clostridium sp. TaxID=59620 RepID=UPI0025ED179F|nr:hypothetical protein [uncultured Clostridium sp.]